ncbi:NAC domain-containing protein JA2-like [Corylus avellana]|uniref:NAC domain-containing protein JA2-like n=1 Tax=Corylus avellana TaxID=13451 RepID=UPI00286B5C62|nr:NAC domain-containing protein JA2-like [Corylus avellana]
MKMLTGFRFRPSNDELINHYLLGKVRGEEITWDGIREFELYGEKIPWELFGDLDSEEEEKHYIFTRLKKSGKRVSRAAGCGTWHESSCNQVYDSEGQCVIGLKKQFCFKVKRESRVEKSHWIMHEFSLAGVFEQERCNNWVLCAVNKKGAETKKVVKRRFQDVQIPSTIVPVEAPTPSLEVESPQAGNTNLLLLEDET